MTPLALSKIEHEIKESPIRKIAVLLARAKADPDIISFGGGAPSLEPPKEVVDAMAKALKDDTFKSVSYGATKGRETLLESISNSLKSDGVDVNPEQIAITTGATGGIFLALEDIVNPGDHVIVADPTYVGYPGPTIIDRAKLCRVPVKWQDNFQITAEAVNEFACKDTKAIILLSPDNPTGRILEEKNVKGIAELAEDHDFWLISDETYKDIVYEGEHVFVSKFAPDRTLTVCSFSKSASMPGLRLGYVYGPKEAIYGITKFNQYVSLTPNTLSQIGAEAFYKVKDSYLKNTVLPSYTKRMEKMGKFLKKYLPGCGFTKPQGAFYYFVDFSKHIKDDEKFTNKLLKEKKVVVIPGKYFGENGKSHLRLTFVSESVERIEEGITRIASLLK